MKIYKYDVVFQEFPDEVTLALNISNCPHRCPWCHSDYLQGNEGIELTYDYLMELIKENNGVTCVGFMGGDGDISELNKIAIWVKEELGLKTGWYSGNDYFKEEQIKFFDYIKIGPYIKERGGLNEHTTNQVLFKIEGNYVRTLRNITYRLQR